MSDHYIKPPPPPTIPELAKSLGLTVAQLHEIAWRYHASLRRRPRD